MDNNKQFETIGKQLPYNIPEGFFESITAKTLRKVQSRKKNKIIKYYLTAVTIAATVIICIVLFWPNERVKHVSGESFVLITEPNAIDTSEQQAPFWNNDNSEHSENTISVELSEKEAELLHYNPADESLEDLLANLNDEELKQLYITITYEEEIEIEELLY